VPTFGALLRVDAGLLITFDDSAFGAFINAATTVNTIIENLVSYDSLLKLTK